LARPMAALHFHDPVLRPAVLIVTRKAPLTVTLVTIRVAFPLQNRHPPFARAVVLAGETAQLVGGKHGIGRIIQQFGVDNRGAVASLGCNDTAVGNRSFRLQSRTKRGV
jgi:hypothetical protein